MPELKLIYYSKGTRKLIYIFIHLCAILFRVEDLQYSLRMDGMMKKHELLIKTSKSQFCIFAFRWMLFVVNPTVAGPACIPEPNVVIITTVCHSTWRCLAIIRHNTNDMFHPMSFWNLVISCLSCWPNRVIQEDWWVRGKSHDTLSVKKQFITAWWIPMPAFNRRTENV